MYLQQSESTASLSLSSQRKRELLDHFEKNGDELDRWREFNVAYHEDDRKFMQFLIPPGKRVLELGCGRGDLLAALKPSYGVGIDFSAETIAKANARHPDLYFVLGDVEDPATLSSIEGPFDYIVLADTIGMFEDIDGTLRLVHHLCAPSTRIIISYYSHLWEPVLKLAEALHLRSKQPKINYIATADFLNLMDLADFEMIREERRQLLPRRCRGSGNCACGRIWSGAPSRCFRIASSRSASSFPAGMKEAMSRAPFCGCRNSAPPRRFCSSREIPATARSRNASGSAMPIGIAGTSRS